MRRFTFSVMLALATVAVNAQETGTNGWETYLSTTEKTADLQRGGAMAIDNEGNSIVTGSFDKEFEFGLNYLEPIATSAFIAKYDKTSERLWAASLQGSATITTVTTDAEGNVYAAGVFADAVNIIDHSGEKMATINGMDGQTSQVSGFIVKFNKDGIYQASKVVIPEVDAEINNKIASAEFSWAELSPTFIPKKLLTDGKRLYMSVSYKDNATIDNVTLVGSYVNQDNFIFQDATAMGILSLNASNLDDTKIISTCKATEKENEVIYNTEDVNFAINGEDVYVAYVASGKSMTVDFEGNTTVIPLENNNGKQEHAFILSNKNATKVYNSIATENLNLLNFVDEMEYQNGNLYLAGTFNEAFPFDNSKSYVGGSDTYLASLKASDLTQNWALTSGYDEGDAMHKAEVVTAMAVFDNEVQLAGWTEATNGHVVDKCLTFFADTDVTPTAFETKAGDEASFVTSAAHNGIYTIMQSDNKDEEGATEGRYTYEFNIDPDDPTGIKQVAATSDNTINFDGNTVTLAKAADIDLYTVSGALVKSAKNVSSLSLDNVASGMYLLKAGKQTVKIVK